MISLCTIILHAHEVEALSCWIDKHPGSLHEWFNKQFVSESTRLILENSNCRFNDECFLQTNGTAMWKVIAPKNATLSMR